MGPNLSNLWQPITPACELLFKPSFFCQLALILLLLCTKYLFKRLHLSGDIRLNVVFPQPPIQAPTIEHQKAPFFNFQKKGDRHIFFSKKYFLEIPHMPSSHAKPMESQGYPQVFWGNFSYFGLKLPHLACIGVHWRAQCTIEELKNMVQFRSYGGLLFWGGKMLIGAAIWVQGCRANRGHCHIF